MYTTNYVAIATFSVCACSKQVFPILRVIIAKLMFEQTHNIVFSLPYDCCVSNVHF